jgi:hypothetical protein
MSGLAPEVRAVAGNMDHLPLPPSESLVSEGWRISMIHGSGVYPRGDPDGLEKLALKLDAEILLNGHTHADAVYSMSGSGREIIFVNPGSATGIPGGTGGSLKPSLAVLELVPEEATVQVFRISGGELETERWEFRRGGDC